MQRKEWAHLTETAKHDRDKGSLPATDLLRRILAQRAQRFSDPGPELGPLGVARFRLEATRLVVAFADIPANALSEAITRVVQHVRARGLGAVWSVTNDQPDRESLTGALVAHGFKLDERLILMARRGPLSAPLNPAISVSPVTSFAAMRQYEYGSRGAFYDDPTPEESLVTARASERWRQQEERGWFRYYTASLGATIVGGLYISRWEEAPTIMGVYTLASVRRQGVATAALTRAIDDLLAAGRDAYCLYVKDGNPARRLYEELSFRALGFEENYVWGG